MSTSLRENDLLFQSGDVIKGPEAWCLRRARPHSVTCQTFTRFLRLGREGKITFGGSFFMERIGRAVSVSDLQGFSVSAGNRMRAPLILWAAVHIPARNSLLFTSSCLFEAMELETFFERQGDAR